MKLQSRLLRPALLSLLLASVATLPTLSAAQDPAAPAAKKKPAAKAPPKRAKAAPPAPVEYVPEAATAEQIDASKRVYYGPYGCEFKQTVEITENAKYPAYVDVQFGKLKYTMKPVLSSTGALRLEDIKGETLMVQIAMKSMMLNVVSGHRMVDDCINPQQRAAIDAAAAAKVAEQQQTTGAAVAAEANAEVAASAAAAKK